MHTQIRENILHVTQTSGTQMTGERVKVLMVLAHSFLRDLITPEVSASHIVDPLRYDPYMMS